MAIGTKVDVRQKLVDTAARLFYTQGYRATGINQIIDEADVCKASFYNHFPTKEDLLVAWLERSHNEATAKVHSLLAQPLVPRDLVREIFALHESELSASAYRGCPFMNCLAEIPMAESRVRQVIDWHRKANRQLLEEIVARATREQRLKPPQLTALVDDLEVIIQGGVTSSRLAQDAKQLRQAHRLAERILGLA